MPKRSNTVQRGARKSKRPARIVSQPAAGITEPAPYWRGRRAETIVAKRVKSYVAKRSRSRTPRDPNAPRPPKSISQRLRRLERNLTRRKTLAGRQSVERQIKALKAELNAKYRKIES